MAAPVITGTEPAGPLTFAPGETKQIRVLASDPDNAPPVELTFRVADAAGNPASVIVSMKTQDDLTYSADPAPEGWTVTQSATDPAVFSVKAP